MKAMHRASSYASPVFPPGASNALATLMGRYVNGMAKARPDSIHRFAVIEGWYPPLNRIAAQEGDIPGFTSAMGYHLQRDKLTPVMYRSPSTESEKAMAGTAWPDIQDYAALKSRAQEWADGVSDIAHTAQCGIVLAASLASPLVCLTNTGIKAMLAVVYGFRGTYKTSVMRVAASAWHHPESIMNGGTVTHTGSFNDRAMHYRHVPVFIDEMPIRSREVAGALFQTYSQGKPKPRQSNNAGDGYREISTGSWNNFGVVSTNDDPFLALDQGTLKDAGEATKRRILPIRYPTLPRNPLPGVLSAKSMADMKAASEYAVEHKFGAYGPYFISLVQNNMQDFLVMYDEALDDVMYELSNVTDNMYTHKVMVALCVAAARFAVKHTSLNIDPNAIGTEMTKAVAFAATKFGDLMFDDERAYTEMVNGINAFVVEHYMHAPVSFILNGHTVNKISLIGSVVDEATYSPRRDNHIGMMTTAAEVPHSVDAAAGIKSLSYYWVREDVLEQALVSSGVGVAMHDAKALFKAKMNEHLSQYPEYLDIVTDGIRRGMIVSPGVNGDVTVNIGVPKRWICVPQPVVTTFAASNNVVPLARSRNTGTVPDTQGTKHGL